MRKFSLLLLSVVIIIISCNDPRNKTISGNGELVTDVRAIGELKGVEVVGQMNVYLLQGEASSVKIEADKNLLEYLEIDLKGGVLTISTKEGYNLRPKAGLKIYVTSPVFNTISVVGSGDVQSQTKLTNSNDIEIDISGSGNVLLDVDAPRINSEINGSGTVTFKGNTKNFQSDINGSGEVHAFELLSETAEINISGSGNIEVFASKLLDVEIAGSGDIQYKGDPVVKQSKAGSGDIRKVQ